MSESNASSIMNRDAARSCFPFRHEHLKNNEPHEVYIYFNDGKPFIGNIINIKTGEIKKLGQIDHPLVGPAIVFKFLEIIGVFTPKDPTITVYEGKNCEKVTTYKGIEEYFQVHGLSGDKKARRLYRGNPGKK